MVGPEDVFLILSLIPAGLDDFQDYYIDDFMWLPTLPVVAHSIAVYGAEVYTILLFYLVVFIPVYIMLQAVENGIGEGDMILYLIYVFYAPYFGGLAAYLLLILLTNMIGLGIPYIRRGLGLEGDAIPLVSAGAPALAVTAILL